jgi:hypothetical protein
MFSRVACEPIDLSVLFNTMAQHLMFLLIFGGLFAFLIVRYYESGEAQALMADLRKFYKSLGIPGRVILGVFLVVMAYRGGAKAPPVTSSMYRTLFWHGDDIWALLPANEAKEAAEAKVATATDSIAQATNIANQVTYYVETNNVVTLSFDWHSPNRLPYHDRQNVLGRTVWVTPTNILGVLYEDHYVAFNESATTNPAVILIEYSRRLDDGTVQRFISPTITNSFPTMYPITVQSGTHTCYWFRCEVPAAFTNCCVRDWNGEALFGSPEGSNKGFDLLGTLVVDDGDNIWQGSTTNIVVGGVTNEVRNGIILEN